MVYIIVIWLELQCPVSCGEGDQIRQVSCVDVDLEQPGEGCDPAEQPTATQKCNTQLCPQAQHSAHGM